MKHNARTRAVFAGLAFLCVALFLFGGVAAFVMARQQTPSLGPPVVVTLPQQFTGQVVIRVDPKAGETPSRDEVAIQLRVPADGSLTLTHADFLMTLHDQVVQYTDGSIVPQHRRGEPTEPDSVYFDGFFAMGPESDRRYIAYVGTAEQIRQFHPAPTSAEQ